MQTYLEKEERVEHEILLKGTIKALKEARIEVGGVMNVAESQGELLGGIQKKITDAEHALLKASRRLTVLMRVSKRKRFLSMCLLVVATIGVFTLFAVSVFR